MGNLLPLPPAPSYSLPTSSSSPYSLLPSPSPPPLPLPPCTYNFSAPLTLPGPTTCCPAILTDLPWPAYGQAPLVLRCRYCGSPPCVWGREGGEAAETAKTTKTTTAPWWAASRT